jgi:hypothetical protein
MDKPDICNLNGCKHILFQHHLTCSRGFLHWLNNSTP